MRTGHYAKVADRALSDNEGNLSSMRIVFVFGMVSFFVSLMVILFCIVWVVLKKEEFPAGFWAALASITGGISSLTAGKVWQTSIERKYPVVQPNQSETTITIDQPAPSKPGSESNLED